MGKSSPKARPLVYRFKVPRLETGFSMLEAVVVVGVLLALAIAGFFSYGAITDNAKRAKVKAAASEVYTGVVVADSDGDPATKPKDVIDGWNDSTDLIYVEILEPASGPNPNGDFCVQASSIPSPTIIERAGSCSDVTGPGSSVDTDGDGIPDSIDPDIDGDGIPNADDPTPNGENTGNTPFNPVIDVSSIQRTTWDTSIPGCQTIILPLTGNTNANVNWGDGTTTDAIRSGASSAWARDNLATHTYGSTGVQNITVTGTFEGWGSWATWSSDCITKVDSWGDGTGTTYMSGGFYGVKNLQEVQRIPLTVTNISDLFEDSTFNGDISNWDTSNVTDMSYVFCGSSAFSGDISNWKTAKVTTMRAMFCSAPNFNSDISRWDVSKVEDMNGLFDGATKFNQNITGWNVANVNYMGSMFRNNKAFNYDISGWMVDKVVANGDWAYANFNASSALENAHIPAAFREPTEVTFTPLASSNTSQTVLNAMNAHLAYVAHPDLLAALQVRNSDPAPYDSWEGRSNPSQVRKDFEAVWGTMTNNIGEYANYTQLVDRPDNNVPELLTYSKNGAVTAFYWYETTIKGQQKYVNAVRAVYQAALDAPRLETIPSVNSVSYTPIPSSAGTISQVNWANARMGYISSKYNLYLTWVMKNGYQYNTGDYQLYTDMNEKLHSSPEGIAWQRDAVDRGMDYYDDTLLSIPDHASLKAELERTRANFIDAKDRYLTSGTSFADTAKAQTDYVKAMQEYYPVAFANVKLIYP